MIDVDEQLTWILDRIRHTDAIDVDLHRALGCALASDVRSAHDLPLWDASAMDGYAIRADDVSRRDFRVIGEVPAGSRADPKLERGHTARIMTGAPVPSDAGLVIPVEATSAHGDAGAQALAATANEWGQQRITVRKPGAVGANIRRRGEDVGAGAIIGRAGDRVGPAMLSACAAGGVPRLEVHRRPRIAIITTGTELRPSDGALERGQIHESNSILLSAMLSELGSDPCRIEHSRDEPAQFAELLSRLASEADIVITTGGIGPGQHDIVRLAIADEPGMRAVRVAARPGQPQAAGQHRSGAFVFALPGNPVSAAVGFELFVRPAILHASGHSRIQRTRIPAIAAESWAGTRGRLQVLPVRIFQDERGLCCTPAIPASRVAHSVAGHGSSDGYALIPADRGDITAGESVEIIEVRR